MITYLGRSLSAMATAMRSYKKAIHTSTPVPTGYNLDDFNSVDNRVARYCFWWAMYENNAYDNVRPWAGSFKTQWSLPTNVRGCYNPFARLGNFWAQHIWIGSLDPMKQNGRVADSAIPVITKNEAIREPLARLWRDSNWASNKDLAPRCGAVMGDFGLRVDDDPRAGKVRIMAVNPATVAWTRADYQGNIDAYIIRERRPDPRYDPRDPGGGRQEEVEYEERCTREGDTIYYQTFLEGEPYGWGGNPPEWEVEYGFVPLVFSPHIKPLPDSCYGWSESHLALTKAVECDHIGSNLHSQIRKASDPRWWVSGTQPPPTTPRVNGSAPSAANPQPREQKLPMFYGGPGSSATAMVFQLDIQFTSMEIQNQIANLEKDYPENRYESARATGDASAKALREVRKACEAKVHGRRAAYDHALSRAHMMALSIGGMRGYDGYEAFDIGSYAAGDLDHAIGDRTVFLLDPLDRMEELQAKFTAWQTAKLAQVPDAVFMEMANFSPEMIRLFNDSRAAEVAQALNAQITLLAAEAQAKAAAAPPPSSSSNA